MTFVRRLGRELVSLFVDDGVSALVTVGWIAFACGILPQLVPQVAVAPLLFLGLLATFAVGLRSKRRMPEPRVSRRR